MTVEQKATEEHREPRQAYLYRQRDTPEDPWSSWKLAELGIPSLLMKARDHPEVWEVVELVELTPEVRNAISTANQFEEQRERLQKDAPEGSTVMPVWAYYKWPNLVIYACPVCGTTGPKGSECPHDGGVAYGGDTKVPRAPHTLQGAEEGESCG